MSENFEPVYYVSEHGRVQRINAGSRIPIPASASAGEAKKKEKNIYVVIPKDVEVNFNLTLCSRPTLSLKCNYKTHTIPHDIICM